MARPILALAGGVGGAKLAHGLAQVLPPDDLAVVVNTGDDETFHGLHVSPDLDTVMYTLAGLVDTDKGWGVVGDTFNALAMLRKYDASAWFGLGDRDLATHIQRTQLMDDGWTLTEVTQALGTKLGVQHAIVPMSDDPVRTVAVTDEGELPFQAYFVRRHCEPKLCELRFEGAETAQPSPGFHDALERARALIICPSNPFLSIQPILALKGVKGRIEDLSVPKIAVSPIVGGRAIKGPAAKILHELGREASCVEIAREYRGLCDTLVIDDVDRNRADEIERLGIRAQITGTVMTTDADRAALARHILSLVDVDPPH